MNSRVAAVTQQQSAAQATRRSEETRSAPRRLSRNTRLAAVAVTGLAAATLLTGCSGQRAEASAPKKVIGKAAPVVGDSAKEASKRESSSPSSSAKSSGGGSSEDDRSPTSPSDDKAGGGSSGGGTGGSGQGPSGSGPCKTSQLAFSTSNAATEGSTLVNMKNTGSAACTLNGFPGADLRSGDGTLNASRTDLPATAVSVKPGQSTHFSLNYTPNESGGSGVTFNSLVVTPPNETHSQTLPVSVNLAASDNEGSSVTVDPIGVG